MKKEEIQIVVIKAIIMQKILSSQRIRRIHYFWRKQKAYTHWSSIHITWFKPSTTRVRQFFQFFFTRAPKLLSSQRRKEIDYLFLSLMVTAFSFTLRVLNPQSNSNPNGFVSNICPSSFAATWKSKAMALFSSQRPSYDRSQYGRKTQSAGWTRFLGLSDSLMMR